MQKVFFTAVAIAVALTGQATAACFTGELVEAGKLQMSINPTLPPQQYVNENGELLGLNPELGVAIAEKLCLEPVFVRMDAPSMIPGLQAQRFDMINTGLFWTSERAETLAMVPYGKTGSGVMARPDTTLEFDSPDDLAGVSLAVEVGSISDRRAQELSAELVAKGLEPVDIRGFANGAEAMAAVNAQQVEATMMPTIVGIEMEQRGTGKVLLRDLWPSDITFTFIDESLATAVADALTELKAEGTYDEIFAKFGLTPLEDDAVFEIKGPTS